MEFDTPGTKYIFIGIGVVFFGLLTFLTFNVYKSDVRYETEIRERRLACNTLKPKFGSLFIVRSGFYEGQTLKAKSLKYDEYVIGDIIEKTLIGNSVLVENIGIECPMLKTLEGK